jgi:hypothetical protein
MDERIQDKWSDESKKKALDMFFQKFLTPEGREWIEFQIRNVDNKDHVRETLAIFSQTIEEHKETGDILLACEMVSVAVSIIQASMASILFQREKNSWEN